MTPDEFRTARARLMRTQVQIAKLLGVDPQTIWRWEHGSTIPEATAMLVRILAETKEREQ